MFNDNLDIVHVKATSIVLFTNRMALSYAF